MNLKGMRLGENPRKVGGIFNYIVQPLILEHVSQSTSNKPIKYEAKKPSSYAGLQILKLGVLFLVFGVVML